MNSNKKIYTFCQTQDTDYVAASQEQEHSKGSYICRHILNPNPIFVKHSAPTMSSTFVFTLILNQTAKSVLWTPLSY
jgi:hypothetical protein